MKTLALVTLISFGFGCRDKAPAADGDSGSQTVEAPADPCAALPALPATFHTWTGFTGAEDFAFDDEGWLVSMDSNGNLVRQNLEGDLEVILPNLARETSGIRILPGGDIVVNDVIRNAVVRVTPGGGYFTLLSGLRYPNGLDVDQEGWIYVSEQGGKQIRRVHPETGEFTIIAQNLRAPNGLGFSPDDQVLYSANFGGGGIDAVTRGENGWSQAAFAETPGLELPAPCEGLSAGDDCLMEAGGLGICGDDEGALSCLVSLDEAACDGAAVGDPCDGELLGETFESACTEAGDGALFCPSAPANAIAACDSGGGSGNSRCWIDEVEGNCARNWEGVSFCLLREDQADVTAPCADAEVGDSCEVMDPAGPYASVCVDASSWGGGQALRCEDPSILGWYYGYLDGLNVDACGNVYVTEYIQGKIWRFPAEGGEAELVVTLPTAWIPNMHWGNGVGGWKKDVLYVMDRMGAFGGGGSGANLYGVELGIEGRPLVNEID